MSEPGSDDSVVFVFQGFGVRVRIQQLVELIGVGQFDHVHPAVAVGIFVDGFRLVRQRRVDLDDGAADRAVDVGGGLHRLDDRDLLVGLGGRADFGQLDVDQVTQQALGVVGNTDGDAAIAFDTGPLMGLLQRYAGVEKTGLV